LRRRVRAVIDGRGRGRRIPNFDEGRAGPRLAHHGRIAIQGDDRLALGIVAGNDAAQLAGHPRAGSLTA